MIRYALLSENGSRDHNEDAVSVHPGEEGICLVLADGLGGHGKGEVASQIAVETSIRLYQSGVDPSVFLDNVFEKVQEAIVDRQKQDRSCCDMKTTMVTVCIDKELLQWGHIGDSRLYYFENGKIKKRTLDHSVPQMLVAVGEIREKDIRRHPDRNRLLKVLGVDMDIDDLTYSVGEPEVRKGRQACLLCSDGFWELIEDKKMEALYRKAKTPEEWLKLMEQVVLKNGKGTNMDNYSAAAVWIDE